MLNSFLSCYMFILYFDYCSFTRVDSVSPQLTSLLYVHGFIMMSPWVYHDESEKLRVASPAPTVCRPLFTLLPVHRFCTT